jgi:hypothetical protein
VLLPLMIARNKTPSNWFKMLVVFAAGLSRLLASLVVRLSSGRHTVRSGAIVEAGAQFASPTGHSSMPTLHITAIVQHGHIVEIRGSTDPGPIVMINGQTASTLFDGNAFRHFLGPLPSGTSIISVTSQDQQGGVNTQQAAVTIE